MARPPSVPWPRPLCSAGRPTRSPGWARRRPTWWVCLSPSPLDMRIWGNPDSGLVLAGHEAPRLAEPLALVDVLRAAASEIEEYDRVILDVQQGVWVSGSAATDTVHLLAELLENATTFSPETAQVIVSGHALVGGGSLITITDAGTGMSDEELALFNWQLDNPAPPPPP